MGSTVTEAQSAWNALDGPWQAAFEEAWASWGAGCFGIGCVISDGRGSIVARGRNRVLESRAKPGVIAEALIAHAEMNALSALDLDRGTGVDLTLSTTMEPCLMCASAIIMVRISEVRFAAADPMFDGLHDVLAGHPYCAERMPTSQGPLGGPIVVFAGLLPLMFNMTWTPHGRWMRLHGTLFPEHHRLAADLLTTGRLSRVAAGGGTALDGLTEIWDRLLDLPTEAAAPR